MCWEYTVRIAHISDLHLRHSIPGTSRVNRRLSRRIAGLFSRAISRIAELEPDLVIVTGDVLDYPEYALDDEDMQRRALDDLNTVRELLDSVNCPYVVVHGNHDHPTLTRRVFPKNHDDVQIAGHRVVSFYDDEVLEHFPQRMGTEREKFNRVLEDASGIPQIHVQHYLVWPEKREGYPHSYREADELHRRIIENGHVRLVLSGHYHAGIEPFRESDTWFAVAPAFAEPPHTFRVYDLDDTELKHHTVCVDPEPRVRHRAVFLDRDGTINPQPSYRWGPERMSLIPGAAHALRRLADAGYLLVIVSNQTCVGYGWVTASDVAAVNDRMSTLLLDEANVDVDGVYVCHAAPNAALPEWQHHDPPDLKPNPGMFLRAASDLSIGLARSFVVGDAVSDAEAGIRAGLQGTIIVRTGNGQAAAEQIAPGHASTIVEDIKKAADWILSQP